MICNFQDLAEAVQNKDVIVYGAGIPAEALIDRLKKYTGRIYVAVSNAYCETQSCAGMQVKNIETYKNWRDSCVVLIAARYIFQNEMEANARSLGYSNIIRVSECVFNDLHAYRMNKRTQFLQFYTMNLMRLKNLKNKVGRGEKIRVVFILTNKAKFNFASLYRSMQKNPLFELILFVFDEAYGNDDQYYNDKFDSLALLSETKEYAQQLSLDGFNVVWGHDEKNNAISIEDQEPDIIIYNAPYFYHGPQRVEISNHYLKKITSKYLSCHFSYGMNIQSHYEYHFENDCILPSWLYFLGNKQEYNLAVNSTITDGLHCVLSGHPMFDGYIGKLNFSIPEKLKDKKKIIVYAPHWFRPTFHIFGKCILAFLQEYPDIGFVFKPHQNLKIRAAEPKNKEIYGELLTPEGYDEYCRTWENSQNGVIVTDSSYIEWFRSSDCLITDSYSFILTWLPTDKPCIYLQNPRIRPEDTFSYYHAYIKNVLESYYLCDNAENIKKLLEDVVINGNDVKADERRKQKEDVIYNLGHAGEYIANYIEKQLRS